MSVSRGVLFTLASILLVQATAPKGVWDQFNPAPSTRVVSPSSIFSRSKFVSGDLKHGILLKGNGTSVSIDWGKEIGGLLSFSYTLSSVPSASVNTSLLLSFTESPLYIRPFSSDSSIIGVPNTTYDGVLTIPFSSLSPSSGALTWTMPPERLRGGFRYLTLTVFDPLSEETQSITLKGISTNLTFSTHMDNLRDYGGYFYAKDPNPSKWSLPGAFDNISVIPPNMQKPAGFKGGDTDFLTKLFYAGAYTLQTNLVPLDTGRAEQPHAPVGTWWNNGTLGIKWNEANPPPPGSEGLDIAPVTIVDGAKRDRAVWPGDMYHALPTMFVSLPSEVSLTPAMNAVATMFKYLNPTTGALPESGPPLLQLSSDTYHMWLLIGVYNTYIFSGETAWLQNLWSNYTFAVSYITNKTVPLSSPNGAEFGGLLNVTGLRDWARFGQGGLNTEANAIYYKLLSVSADLAGYLNDTTRQATYTSLASKLKETFNDVFWDDAAGLYRDNNTAAGSLIHPQDANSMAILFNLTTSTSNATRISQALTKRWGTFGPSTPELPDCVSPFISGFELLAHFESCSPSLASELIHTLWGYMLYAPLSVGGSTLIEGLTTNGSIAYRWNDGYGNDPSYTSHAHGWSTAPSSVLINYVLGIKFASPAGKEWTLRPFLMGLEDAEGGFEGVTGWYGVKWSLQRNSGSSASRGGVLTIKLSTPSSTKGTLSFPACNGVVARNGISVDGKVAASSRSAVEVQGGERSIKIKFDSIVPI